METCNVGLSGSVSPNFIGCLPCSHNYLTASYFDNHNSLLDSDFHDFLSQNISSDDVCNRIINYINEIRFSDLNRYLIGEGSHRHLVSQMRFDSLSEEFKRLDGRFCETIIIERLPVGVFVDPFELQHLVERKGKNLVYYRMAEATVFYYISNRNFFIFHFLYLPVFSAAAVFGDTNLELPSVLSNRSIVEIHIDFGIASKSSKTVVQLPLHARYPVSLEVEMESILCWLDFTYI